MNSYNILNRQYVELKQTRCLKILVWLAYHALGRRKEADEALTNYIANYQNDWAYFIAEIYAFRGEKNKAFEWLEKAYTRTEVYVPWFKGDPLLKNLDKDPRHSAFLKKMNLPPD